MLIRETIKYKRNDMNLKIKLGSHDAFTGYQQEIDKLTSFTTTDLVNPETDAEVRRFKHFTDVNYTIQFEFYKTPSIIPYSTSFVQAGFTLGEVTTRSNNILNSFFILDYYDSYDSYTQNKIFSQYLTKLVSSGSTTAVYSINPTVNNQFYRWNVPVSYIESLTGDTVTGYVKFSFYNAKTGKIQLFYNLNNTTPETSERLYFKTELNKVNKTWRILTINPIITAREFISPFNQLYADRVNDTFDNFENLQQNYPTGNTFNYSDGTYLMI